MCVAYLHSKAKKWRAWPRTRSGIIFLITHGLYFCQLRPTSQWFCTSERYQQLRDRKTNSRDRRHLTLKIRDSVLGSHRLMTVSCYKGHLFQPQNPHDNNTLQTSQISLSRLFTVRPYKTEKQVMACNMECYHEKIWFYRVLQVRARM